MVVVYMPLFEFFKSLDFITNVRAGDLYIGENIMNLI